MYFDTNIYRSEALLVRIFASREYQEWFLLDWFEKLAWLGTAWRLYLTLKNE